MFALSEIASLLEIAANLSLTTQWGKHFVAVQHVAPLALKFNSNKVLARGKNKHLIDLLASKNVSIENFYLSKASNKDQNSTEKFNIIKSM